MQNCDSVLETFFLRLVGQCMEGGCRTGEAGMREEKSGRAQVTQDEDSHECKENNERGVLSRSWARVIPCFRNTTDTRMGNGL